MRTAASSDARTTRTCTLWIEDGIAIGRFLDGATVDAADARENLAALGELGGGKRLPILVDLRGIRSQSAEARATLAGPEASRVSCAVALVVGDPVSRVLGNFYLGFNRPADPTRLFDDDRAARAWLAGFRG